MKHNKGLFIFGLAALPLSIGLNPSQEALLASGDTGGLFHLSAGMKAKAQQFDPDSKQTGLLLYGFDSGVSARFKAPVSGTFSADILAVKESGSPTVNHYTLEFEDEATKKSFRFGVNSYASYSEAYVEYKGVKGGIRYYQNPWNKAEDSGGYTAGYNSLGLYTQYAGHFTKMQFDPASMCVKIMADNGSYQNVWDFSSVFNDGKRLENDLGHFESYNVKLSFDQVVSYSKASLLLTRFGGYDLSKNVEDHPVLTASFTKKGTVGEEYCLPQGRAVSLYRGDLDTAKISTKVYDELGNVVSTADTFTPTKEGKYYIYYEYVDGTERASNFYALPCLTKENQTKDFLFEEKYDSDVSSQKGLHSLVHFPAASIASNALMLQKEEALVRIEKDGKAVEGYEGRKGGFDFSFDAFGDYTVTYYSPTNPSLKDVRVVSITADQVGFALPELPALSLGSTFAPSLGKAYFKGQEAEAKPMLYFPSGKGRDVASTLDEAGRYEIRYEANMDGQILSHSVYFILEEEYASRFLCQTGASAEYGVARMNDNHSGVRLTLNDGKKVVYSKTLDLSDNHFDESAKNLSDNTKLLELRTDPHNPGTADLEAIYVELQDIDRPTNVVTIRVKYLSYMPQFSRIRAKATGQAFTGYYWDFDTGNLGSVDNAEMHEDGGFISACDFTSSLTGRTYENSKLQLFFDSDTNRLYANHWQDYGTAPGYQDNRAPWLVRDFSTNDPTLSGGDAAWTGFTSNKVKMTVYATGVSSTADLLVTNVDGEEMSSRYISDSKGPQIHVSEGDLPKGEVGKTYRYPEFIANDDESKVVSKKVSVYSGNTLIQEGGEGFIPKSSGIYTLVFEAKDAFGNTTRAEKKVEVVTIASPLSIALSGTLPETASMGDLIRLPKISTTGGVGGITTRYSVSCANESVEVVNGSFRIEKKKNYVVRFLATDYVGNEAKITKFISNISIPTLPVTDESKLCLPSALLEGRSYDLSHFVASLYEEDGSLSFLSPTIKVQDGNGQREIALEEPYVPVSSSTTQEATITYSFQGKNGIKEVKKVLPIVKPTNKIGFLASYFHSSNSTIEAIDEGVQATMKKEGTSVEFLPSLFGKKLTATWNGQGMDEYTVKLCDSLDFSSSISLHFTRLGGKLYCSVNGGEAFRYFESSVGEAGFTYLESAHAIYDSLSNQVAVLEDFNGFASGKIRMFVEAECEGTFLFRSINNQIINNVRKDSIGPSVYFEQTLSGRFALGTEIQFPEVFAYDVLNEVKSTVVTISCDGEVLKKGTVEEIGSSYKIEKVGSYKITYLFKDTAGNSSACSFFFGGFDPIAPTLKFTSSFATEVKQGEEIILPTYEIQDQNLETATVLLYCQLPDGDFISVNEKSMKAEQKGTYTFTYMVNDENGNVNFYSFVVTVR